MLLFLKYLVNIVSTNICLCSSIKPEHLFKPKNSTNIIFNHSTDVFSFSNDYPKLTYKIILYYLTKIFWFTSIRELYNHWKYTRVMIQLNNKNSKMTTCNLNIVSNNSVLLYYYNPILLNHISELSCYNIVQQNSIVKFGHLNITNIITSRFPLVVTNDFKIYNCYFAELLLDILKIRKKNGICGLIHVGTLSKNNSYFAFTTSDPKTCFLYVVNIVDKKIDRLDILDNKHYISFLCFSNDNSKLLAINNGKNSTKYNYVLEFNLNKYTTYNFRLRSEFRIINCCFANNNSSIVAMFTMNNITLWKGGNMYKLFEFNNDFYLNNLYFSSDDKFLLFTNYNRKYVVKSGYLYSLDLNNFEISNKKVFDISNRFFHTNNGYNGYNGFYNAIGYHNGEYYQGACLVGNLNFGYREMWAIKGLIFQFSKIKLGTGHLLQGIYLNSGSKIINKSILHKILEFADLTFHLDNWLNDIKKYEKIVLERLSY